jgi:hemolysin III
MTLRLREPVNALTHGFGAALSAAGLVVLVVMASSPARPWHIVSFAIFGAGLVALYLSSALYHALPLGAVGVRRMRKLDHAMIYVLIAATYTPICLIALRGPWGWSLFGVVWGVAAAGIVMKLFWMNAPRWLSTALYLAMGWVVVVALYPLLHVIEMRAFLWLAAGGAFYTGGAVVYGLRRPDPLPGVMGFHEIFHILCILGSLAHFWVMFRYISRIG